MIDYQTAAIKAAETLIRNGITSAPIDPLPILKKTKNVILMSFSEMSESAGMSRESIVNLFGDHKDAVTSVREINGKLCYIVAYNMKLPFNILQRALARELGHIILKHDGSRPEDVRDEEAIAFARHFLCPRPLIKAIQESSIPLTLHVLADLTGCDDRCLEGMMKTPGTDVPAELNRMIREQFAEYVCEFLDYQVIISKEDHSPVADFGSFMEGYKEG